MTPVEKLIRDEMQTRGSMTFARFMELALYAPGAGYYERPESRIGRGGDFYTSVSVGSAFGMLLASRFLESSDDMPMTWIEAGAHDGQLARDVLTAVDRFHPNAAGRISYRILEPSPRRRELQQSNLAEFAGRIAWTATWDDLPGPAVIFSNELLDAFPVHRLGWNATSGRWFEWGVTMDTAEGPLAWCRLPVSASLDLGRFVVIEPHLPDGFVVELSPAAEAWWRGAAQWLRCGWLIALDYGFDEELPVRGERPGGSLRAYSRHRIGNDLLAHPGEQDLTADVDFRSLVRVGEQAGLRTEALLSQGRWLGGIAARLIARGGPAAEWLQANARHLQTLTHPQHLGHSLRVLVQGRHAERVGGPAAELETR